MEPPISRRIDVTRAFTRAASCYWLEVFPAARREIGHLRRRAEDIPDPALRRLALDTQHQKWGNLEGAAAFAAFAPRHCRVTLTRLLVGLQSIYDFADTLMEQPNEHSSANAKQLHDAILAALQPTRPHTDYYARHAHRDDRGYLTRLIDICRAATSLLPGYPLVTDAVLRNAQRIVAYQRYINSQPKNGHPAFANWARRETPGGSDLRWWETGAACGSSTAVFALLAAAANPRLTRSKVELIEATYWPWVGALHTLLDSTIDRAEDIATGQHSLVAHYASPGDMAERMQLLTLEAMRRAGGIGIEHRLILAGMTSLYLSDEQAWLPAARPTAEGVLDTVGGLAAPAMLVLRARRLARFRSGS